MPRGPRPVIPEIPHHIIHRGNNRQQVFFTDKDHSFLIKTIQEAKKEFNCLIYGYCFMKNHIHIIVQPTLMDSLSKMLKLVAGRYTRYINKIYKRTGTLWEGRFKSSPIEQERYLLGCIRYIEMNPVRAKLVKDPRDYRWSSYSKRAFGEDDPILDSDPYYLELGKTSRERREAYRVWFKESFAEDELNHIREGIRRTVPIGSKDFTNKLSQILGRNVVYRPRGRPRREK